MSLPQSLNNKLLYKDTPQDSELVKSVDGSTSHTDDDVFEEAKAGISNDSSEVSAKDGDLPIEF